MRARARILENAELDLRIKQSRHEQSLEHDDEKLHQQHHGMEMTNYLETSLEQRQRGLQALDTQRDRNLELGYLQQKDNQRLGTLGREHSLLQGHQLATNLESLRHNRVTNAVNLTYQTASAQAAISTQRTQNQVAAERQSAQRHHQHHTNQSTHGADLKKLYIQSRQNGLTHAANQNQLSFISGQNQLAARANRDRIIPERAERASKLQHQRVIGQQTAWNQRQEKRGLEYHHRMKMLEMGTERENEMM